MIEIWTATDLNNVRNNLSGSYIQMADIDLAGWGNWTAIVNFAGSYDGQGQTINHMHVDNSLSTKYSGLFGNCAAGAVIKRLGVINAYVKNGYNNSSGTDYKGILCGVFYGSSIENCYVTGELDVGTDRAGGLVGYWSGTRIKNCYAAVSLTGTNTGSWVGGFVGNQASSACVNCYWDTTVAGTTKNGGSSAILKTTAEMKLQATFANWDFYACWSIASGTYPFLILGAYSLFNTSVRGVSHSPSFPIVYFIASVIGDFYGTAGGDSSSVGTITVIRDGIADTSYSLYPYSSPLIMVGAGCISVGVAISYPDSAAFLNDGLVHTITMSWTGNASVTLPNGDIITVPAGSVTWIYCGGTPIPFNVSARSINHSPNFAWRYFIASSTGSFSTFVGGDAGALTVTVDGVVNHTYQVYDSVLVWTGDNSIGVQISFFDSDALLNAPGVHTVVLSWTGHSSQTLYNGSVINVPVGSATWFFPPIAHSFPWVGKFKMCKVP